LPKDSDYFQALGDLDELNCAIGLAREFAKKSFASMPESSFVVQNAEALEEALADDRAVTPASFLDQLAEIQQLLFDAGAAVATPPTTTNEGKREKTAWDKKYGDGWPTLLLERWMNSMDSELPPLRNFILPSGGFAGAHIHMARAICRRAERSIVALKQMGLFDQDHVLIFINRLSDYLFVSSRWMSHKSGEPEVQWDIARVTRPRWALEDKK